MRERGFAMPSKINLESARLRWQAIHNQPLSDEELGERAKISMAALRRMRSGTMHLRDGFKILALCKALECGPSEIIVRE
jgi:DNA-binding Xre family transcriptional regulator